MKSSWTALYARDSFVLPIMKRSWLRVKVPAAPFVTVTTGYPFCFVQVSMIVLTVISPESDLSS